jgi:hypothetical protein
MLHALDADHPLSVQNIKEDLSRKGVDMRPSTPRKMPRSSSATHCFLEKWIASKTNSEHLEFSGEVTQVFTFEKLVRIVIFKHVRLKMLSNMKTITM